ncbi:MAG TPA: glycosyltransferase [candidate division Zixibacteria bacterium]|nr:glycosyltransferase [candidate division Zixibacteria bacterium]
MTSLAPIVLFVYNRPWHTRQTVEALKKNNLSDQSEFFIYSDGSKGAEDITAVSNVREYLQCIDGFKNVKIIEREQNLGLAQSIIQGVTEIIEQFKKVIVLEDDLVSAPFFLKYMNEALHFYERNQKIFSITGYNHPPKLMKIPSGYPHDVYFNPRCMSWSWATWEDRWLKADWEVKCFDQFIRDRSAIKKFNRGGDDLTAMLRCQMSGTIDSWAIRWCFTHYLESAYCLYPIKAIISNIGFDGTGVHCGEDKNGNFENLLSDQVEEIRFTETVCLHSELMKKARSIYKHNGIIMRIVGRLKCLYNRFIR